MKNRWLSWFRATVSRSQASGAVVVGPALLPLDRLHAWVDLQTEAFVGPPHCYRCMRDVKETDEMLGPIHLDCLDPY